MVDIIYVLMGNDYPTGQAFRDMAAAEAEVARLQEEAHCKVYPSQPGSTMRYWIAEMPLLDLSTLSRDPEEHPPHT